MKVVTASQMRELDRKTIQDFGIPSLTLMEKAGEAVAGAVEKVVDAGERVVIVAGKGNNGGDGLVVARHLLKAARCPQVFLLARRDELSKDALHNLKALSLEVREVTDEEGTRELEKALEGVPVVVDAILGTGSRGEVRGIIRKVIELVNASGAHIVSVDVPSGLDSDRGTPLGVCVRASCTVTMGLPKLGLLLQPGSGLAGELKVADIGIPAGLREGGGLDMNLITGTQVGGILPRRNPASHKGDYGHVLVLAGSTGYTGAAALTCQGALLSGAGLVTLGIAASLNWIMEIKLTEVMTRPLPEKECGALGLEAEGPVLALAEEASVVVIGPGLRTHPETKQLVRNMVRKIEKPVVIDADGLNAFAGVPELLAEAGGELVLTPHPGEMARLTGKETGEITEDRINTARSVAEELHAVVVLKGEGTIVATPEGEIHLNRTGNAGMATGGMGDVLTGMIGGLVGQGIGTRDACIASVYAHGLAGDRAREKKGELGLTASRVLDELGCVWREIERERG